MHTGGAGALSGRPERLSDEQTNAGAQSGRRSFLRAAGLVSVITLISRFLGLVRDVVVAAAFGATRYGDIFNIAFELPNLVRRVLGEGSLSAFIVPIFTKVRDAEGDGRAWRFASNALTVLAALSLVLTAAGIVFAPLLFRVFGYGYYQRGDLEAIHLGVALTRIMFPFLALLSLSSILMGLCHAVRHFTMPALGSVALNVSMITAGLIFYKLPTQAFAHILAVSVLLGGLIRLLIMIPPLMRAGCVFRPVFDPVSPAMKRLFLMLLPATFGVAVVQINLAVSRAFATHLGEGFVPTLVYSNRLVQLPLAIVAAALATAILPPLSEHYAKKEFDQLRDLARFACRMIFALFVPATVGLMALGLPIIRLLFERGEWTVQASVWTYQALLAYAPALVVWGVLRIITPIFYARHDVRTPVLTATAAMVVNIVLNVLLVTVAPLRESLGHVGLALANTVGVLVNAGLLFWILQRMGLGLWDASLARSLSRSLIAASLMGLVSWGLWRLFGASWMEQSKLLGMLGLVAVILCSTVAYFAFAMVLKVPDLREGLRLVLRRR